MCVGYKKFLLALICVLSSFYYVVLREYWNSKGKEFVE
jgi:hypothetical protein